jgi:hypothetical protein
MISWGLVGSGSIGIDKKVRRKISRDVWDYFRINYLKINIL